MPRFRLTIAYDGTAFHGWQKQHAPDPERPGERVHLRTVQEVVEQAVRDVVRQPVLLQGASRTDSGVHANAQTAAFTVTEDESIFIEENADSPRTPPVWERLTEDRFRLALNSRLPEDVVITQLARTRDDFEPISDCVAKGYRYTLHAGLDRPLRDRAFVHHVRTELDLARMQDAAARFIGDHDFAAFAAAGHGRLSTVRTVFECSVKELSGEGHLGIKATRQQGESEASIPRSLDASMPISPHRFAIDISGNGFLHNMVRIVAGTIVEVGRGRMEPEQVERAIKSGDRRDAGPTLPPTGLCLMWMKYGD